MIGQVDLSKSLQSKPLYRPMGIKQQIYNLDVYYYLDTRNKTYQATVAWH